MILGQLAISEGSIAQTDVGGGMSKKPPPKRMVVARLDRSLVPEPR